MKTDEGPDGLTENDSYATRTPSPESLEEMAMAGEAVESGSRPRGVSRQEFERSLLDCGFLDEKGLQEALAETSLDDKWSDVEALARTLVRLGKLTRYQAAALFQGKGRALLIGPYEVLGKLGSGGMGMVFKARLRQGGPEVALKLLPPSASKNAHTVARFRREAAILDRLNHPNIVSSHDIGAFGGVHYLVMDYVEGSDLDKVVKSGGPMKLARAVDCVIQAARGLAAAHEQGIVHRDIKPANLLLDTKGTVRVLDLGLARITQTDDTIPGGESSPSLTASGIIMGTVDFVPPEQSDDSKRADHRADIYSLGCTLHFLLTGRPPYSGDTLMQRLLAHHQKPIPSLIDARPEVPVEVDAIFRSMLAKAPEDRPQSMLEVIKRLEAWRGSMAGTKALRVFDEPANSRPGSTPSPSKQEKRDQPPHVEKKAEDSSETYDLMTFIRPEVFEPDADPEQSFEGPAPIPTRKSKQARNLRRQADLALRCLVAAAALVVLIRFFPKVSINLPTASTPVKPSTAPDSPAVVPVAPPKREVVPPKVDPTLTPPTVSDATKAAEPSPAAPPSDRPPPPSLLDRLLGPPPRPEDGPPPPRPREKRPPRPGDGRPPRPGDGPPPRRPGGPPDGGGVPF